MNGGNITGGNWDASSAGTPPASRRMRFAADFIDLLIIPAILGGVFGLLFYLLAASDLIKDGLLTIVYVVWIISRDLYFSPGRWMFRLKLISLGGTAEISLFGLLKIFSFKTAESGLKPSILQIFWRNFWVYPYILVVGYIIEIVGLSIKNERFMDLAARTRVIAGR